MASSYFKGHVWLFPGLASHCLLSCRGSRTFSGLPSLSGGSGSRADTAWHCCGQMCAHNQTVPARPCPSEREGAHTGITLGIQRKEPEASACPQKRTQNSLLKNRFVSQNRLRETVVIKQKASPLICNRPGTTGSLWHSGWPAGPQDPCALPVRPCSTPNGPRPWEARGSGAFVLGNAKDYSVRNLRSQQAATVKTTPPRRSTGPITR